MKKMITTLSICLVIGVLVLTSCQANGANPAPKQSVPTPTPVPAPPAASLAPEAPAMWTPVTSLHEIKYNADTPENILISGKRIFKSSCSACHDLPTTTRIKEFTSDEELIELAIPMSEQSGLPLEYAEKVIRYMLAARHGTAPQAVK